MLRLLSFVVPCLAIGMAAKADNIINGLFQRDEHIFPVRRQATNSTSSVYELVETYDASNFWDKFEFIYTTPTSGDPTHGFVLYQNRTEAERLGLVGVDGDVAWMKVDATTAIRQKNLTNAGRASVRIESLAKYQDALIVGDFAQLPKKQCGSWPAFWTYARKPGWPNGGEIDIYEQWNNYPFNRQTIHVNTSFTGTCNISTTQDIVDPVMTNYNYTQDCNVTQPENIGCSTWDYEGPYGSPTGGVYAMLLSPGANTLKTWTWHADASPFSSTAAAGATNSSSSTAAAANVSSATVVDPSTWGVPNLAIGDNCDIGRTFAPQTIVLNLEVCGDAVSDKDWVGESGCAVETGYNSCWRFAAAEPGAFEGVGFGVRSLRVYQPKQ